MSWKGDPHAFHNDVSGEIDGLTEKATPAAADLLVINDSADGNSVKKVQAGNLPGGSLSVAFARSGELEVVNGALPWPAPFDLTLLGARAAVGTAPTGADLIVDVNKAGTTVYTTQGNRPTISASSTSSSETTPDVTSVSEGDLITVDIDQIGSSTAGSNLVVVIRYRRGA